MIPVYKAWQVFEIEGPEDWAAKKNEVWEKPVICYIDGLDAKVVTVFANKAGGFQESKAEEILWDIFGEPCLYLSNNDFQDFVESWKKFLEMQQDFWFDVAKEKNHTINISLMRKALITIGSYKLLKIRKANKKTYWNENKITELISLLQKIYGELTGIHLTVWGTSDQVITSLRGLGVIVHDVNIEDKSSQRVHLIESVEQADGLLILSGCDNAREMSLQPVLDRMKQKVLIDTCYIYEVAEIEKLGARLLYC